MKTGLALLLWSADPDQPARLATPFAHAAAAAALEMQVEVYFSARAVLLLQPGVAEGLRASERFDKSIAAWMHDALSHGARFFACTDALAAQGLTQADLMPAARHHGGAVQYAARAADPAWTCLVF
ncbi:hypothetical protein DBR42_09495 [Pelomonas sp. HMWF004]|nr:hypothetical protein DBR42_09495 [Pelomonas sp. HMWF004]